MTIAQAAALLGLTPSSLRVQVVRGKLKATHHGPILWVTPREVERYRREHLGRSGRPPGAADKAPRRRPSPSPGEDRA